MWVGIWHFQMILKLVFASWNIFIALINLCTGIISLHSLFKISIIYDSKYHAHSYFDSNVNLWVLLASMKLALMYSEQPSSCGISYRTTREWSSEAERERGVRIQSLWRYSGVNHMYIISGMSGYNHSEAWLHHM